MKPDHTEIVRRLVPPPPASTRALGHQGGGDVEMVPQEVGVFEQVPDRGARVTVVVAKDRVDEIDVECGSLGLDETDQAQLGYGHDGLRRWLESSPVNPFLRMEPRRSVYEWWPVDS